MVSHLIGYGDRLWLANSVKGVNHNSADLYSYDPASGTLSYERHLFSQDAGRPLVAHGLLYWPFEDARSSLGFGHFMVTDGTSWQLGTIPTAQIFHTHAMTAVDGDLIAATSAWRAGYQSSDDQGLTWHQIYDHPTPERRVTRIVRLATLDGFVFGAPDQPRRSWAGDAGGQPGHRGSGLVPCAPDRRSGRPRRCGLRAGARGEWQRDLADRRPAQPTPCTATRRLAGAGDRGRRYRPVGGHGGQPGRHRVA